ncbi:MAG: heme A synthase [Candidatus Eisenbacteria bacterium]
MTRDGFRTGYRLGLATAVLMFGLIVLGSVVRTTGSGLSCPDWPLCEGRLIPRLQFNVLLEWTHRLVALVVGIGLLLTVILTFSRRELRARLAGLATLALALYLAQALLGALTVWKRLDPGVVGGHLATGLLLFATLLTYTLVARHESSAVVPAGVPSRPPGLLATLGVATALTYAQCVMGGIVSTHHAGLACAGWPTCNGEWLPRLEGPVALQTIHRFLAYLLTATMLFTATRLRLAPDSGLRIGAPVALGLTVAQVVLGVGNVFLGLPPWLSALHLATATAILALMVTLTFRAATLPAEHPVVAMAHAR